MYKLVYEALTRLNKGDRAELKRCSLKRLNSLPAYFRILRTTQLQDNRQTQRVVYVLANIDLSVADDAVSVAQALIYAGVKEPHVIQITRSGDNGIDYLKRQLVRCKNIQLDSVGKLIQFWGDQARRDLLKEFILKDSDANLKPNDVL